MEPIVLVIPFTGTHRLIVRQTRAAGNVIAAGAKGVLATDAVRITRLHGSTDERLPGDCVNYPDVLPRHSIRVQPHPLERDVGCHRAPGGRVPTP